MNFNANNLFDPPSAAALTEILTVFLPSSAREISLHVFTAQPGFTCDHSNVLPGSCGAPSVCCAAPHSGVLCRQVPSYKECKRS